MIVKTCVTISIDIDVPLKEDEEFYFKGRKYIFEECYAEVNEDQLEIVINAMDCETEEYADFTSEVLKPSLEIKIDFNNIKFCLDCDFKKFDFIKKV